MSFSQMGHNSESSGRRTVKMGRRDDAAMGGFSISLLSFSGACWGWDIVETFWLDCPDFTCREDKPDMTGGGSSSPSVAFLDNCRAKSDACHHSRNFKANILVGSKNFKLPNTLGARVLGLNIDVTPRFPPATGIFGSSNDAMAR